MRVTHRIQDDARVEDIVGVEQLLELPHELVGSGAPLHLHIRRHIAPSAVLALRPQTPKSPNAFQHACLGSQHLRSWPTPCSPLRLQM